MILAIDQGTTGTTCLVVDGDLRPAGRGYRELRQHFPRPGWVEHDPDEIWDTVLAAAADALDDAGLTAAELQAIGITNQRETAVLWDRRSGHPLHRAIVWQDRRTAEACAALPAELIRERTGLVPDPYFSASKLRWLLDNAAGSTPLPAFGTVDSWLVWRLTGGAAHITDVTNASRTMLCGLDTEAWDDRLLELFGVPPGVLPQIVPSSGELAEAELFGARLPVRGIAGDQQAALFGQGCVAAGQAKVTYGTGCFVLVHQGDRRPWPAHGLLATAAARRSGEPPQYAVEGSIFVAGAALQWLRDGLGLIADSAESEGLARSLDGNDGVYFVPALTGLGSPHWNSEARGLICGLTRGTGRAQLARAALEAIAYQTRDVVEAVPGELSVLRADGGVTANAWLMQFQADILGIPVEVAAEREITALGAAGLVAGGAVSPRLAAVYEPRMGREHADELHAGWLRALDRVRDA
jgi:glycerol kinase